LRHTAAQRFFEATHDLLLVQAFLGHRSLSDTLIYASSVGGVRSHMPQPLPGGDVPAARLLKMLVIAGTIELVTPAGTKGSKRAAEYRFLR
jgi:hypothetical protein